MSTLRKGELLRTIHGSHLYGLSHQDSDEDWYVVQLIGKSRQDIMDGIDTNVVTLEQFLKGIDKGVPQAVEALFSPYAEVDPNWEPFFSGLRPGNSLIGTYRRTILNFGLHHGGRHGSALERVLSTGKVKLRRHALRLCINLNQYVNTGVIQPSIGTRDKNLISNLSIVGDDSYETILGNWLSKSLLGNLSTIIDNEWSKL